MRTKSIPRRIKMVRIMAEQSIDGTEFEDVAWIRDYYEDMDTLEPLQATPTYHAVMITDEIFVNVREDTSEFGVNGCWLSLSEIQNELNYWVHAPRRLYGVIIPLVNVDSLVTLLSVLETSGFVEFNQQE